jgi:nucleotide-binding universal stress UspA family protein
VLDGNHRVSVARELGTSHIQAYVTEVETKASLTPDVRPEDLILKAEYADFMERTQVDRLLPEADLSVSVPSQYEKLEEHVSAHRHVMGIDLERKVSYEEAVVDWYEAVYLPVIRIIREQGILRHFPGRTEADLYLWIAEHRARLSQELSWKIGPVVAATDLTKRFSPTLGRVAARVGEKIVDAAVPEALVPGSPAGEWRRERTLRGAPSGWHERRDESLPECLFASVLVPIDGTETGWRAFGQAVRVARHEGGRLLGLHVASSESEADGDAVRALAAEFCRRAEAAEMPSDLAVGIGGIASTICERGRWADLAVVGLAHPPGDRPIDRLGSGFRFLIQHCPTPILAVPRAPSNMDHILLAYDGSPKADEALYLSAYLAASWEASLVAVTVVEEGRVSAETLSGAGTYLTEHGIQAALVQQRGPVAEVILDIARERGSDLIVMGGYGFGSPLEIVLGSTVDQVLRESAQPVLVCR